MSQAVLMKEYKELSKEKWLQIDVSAAHAVSNLIAKTDSR